MDLVVEFRDVLFRKFPAEQSTLVAIQTCTLPKHLVLQGSGLRCLDISTSADLVHVDGAYNAMYAKHLMEQLMIHDFPAFRDAEGLQR